MLNLVRSFFYTPHPRFSEEFLLHSHARVSDEFYAPNASFSEEFL